MMRSLYIYLGLGAAVVVLGLYAWGLTGRLDLAETERDNARKEFAALNEVLITERKNLVDAQNRAFEYQLQRDKSDEENEAMRNCIADKSCGVRVNVVYRTVRDPNTGACGAVEADAESQRQLEQNYLRLDRELSLMEDNYLALQKELIVRSDPDYCRANKKPSD